MLQVYARFLPAIRLPGEGAQQGKQNRTGGSQWIVSKVRKAGLPFFVQKPAAFCHLFAWRETKNEQFNIEYNWLILCEFDDRVRVVILLDTSQDLADKYPDAAIIRDLISRGVIKIVNPGQQRPQLPLSLHRGEEDALLLALSGDSLFAADDGKAIKAASFFKIPFIITPRIIVDLFKLEKITLEKARMH